MAYNDLPEILSFILDLFQVSCDLWSLGVLAYEFAIGFPPFTAQNTSTVYMKILNHKNHLKFPPEILVSEAYVSLIKHLLTDEKDR